MATSVKENLHLAYDTVRSHKLRSALTILGVFVGTVTLMAIGSILTGMNKTVVDQIDSFGTNTIFVYKFQPGIRTSAPTREERTRKPLSDRDIAAVKSGCTACAMVSAEVVSGNFGPRGGASINARVGSHEVDGLQFTGPEPNLAQVTNQTLQQGRYFTEAENQHRVNVVVVGHSIADALFPTQDPIGKDLQIDGTTFRLIGVFAPRKGAGPSQQDLQAQIPYLTYEKLYPSTLEHVIIAQSLPGK